MKDRRLLYVLSALGGAFLTAGLLLIVYGIFDLYPFGKSTLSWCDMEQQVVPLLCNFKDILSGDSGFFLSMANAGGMGFWGVFFFFLASPFSFLVVFVDKADMLLFVNLLVLMKMALSGATAALFLRRTFPSLSTLAGVSLSAAYGLCGFSLMFYQNVIWLDMVWSFPLLLWSLLRLSEKKKPLFFIVMLSLSMVMNYYIGYMVVVFLLLAVPLWIFLCLPREDRGKVSLLFILSCLVAALLTAPVWLPSLLQFTQSARGTSLLDSLSSGALLGSYNTKSLLLFCTPVMFAALPFVSFRQGGATGRRRLWCLSMFLLLLFASLLEPVNKMWHTGNYQAFPLRYGYMIVLLGLMLCASVLSTQPDGPFLKMSLKGVFVAVFSVSALLFAGRLLNRTFFEEMTTFTSTLWGDNASFTLLLLWCLVGIFAFAALFSLAKKQAVSKGLLSLFLCLSVSICCLFNGGVYIGSAAGSDTSYREQTDLAGRIQDDSFYRVKVANKYFSVNRTGALGYNSLAHYTSLTDQDYMFAMKKLGYSSYWMEVNSNGGTLLTDAILRNRYVITKNDTFGFSSDTVYRNNTYRLVKSAYDLPAAVVLSADPSLHEWLPDGERCELQDHLYQLYSGTSETLVTRYEPSALRDVAIDQKDGLYCLESPSETGTLTYRMFVEGRQALYFDGFKDLSNSLREVINDSFSVRVNGTSVQRSYPSQASNGLLYLGDFENETVTVTVTLMKNALASSFGVFSVDAHKVADLCTTVRGCDLTVSGNRITTTVSGCNGEYLYTCLPYDNGYLARVNGVEVPLYRVNDAFLAIPLSEGTNDIELVYRPSGWIPGLVLAGMGLVFLLLLLLFLRRGQVFCGRPGTLSCLLLYAVGILTFGAIYLFPLVVFAVK